ncbi:zinc finger, CCHC-type containing protein [Tanacetum coccineum]|uniref:Zinc finger, CCHC-type containing protein n=1 Tax=Tanacetum coccineum TaxID=301880 RepID=A0ABQ5AH21_9ASTR
MDAAAMKHMASNFAKLDKFEGVDFRRWNKKMRFLLSSISVVYVLTTLILDDGDDAIVYQLRKRAKWDNDDYVCKGLILIGMSDSLFDIYHNVESSTEMTDSRPVLEQYNELLGILGRTESRVLRFPKNRTEDIGGSVVPEEVTEEETPKTFDDALSPRMLLLKRSNTLMRWTPSWATTLGCWLDLPLVARISTIRLLIAMASIHNLIIHQMDVKTAFLNDDLDEEDIGEADVILGIRIKHESNGITISQSHYIEKVLKKFNYFDCTLVSTTYGYK